MDALDRLAFSFPTMVRALLRLLPAAHIGPGLRRRRGDMPWRIACRSVTVMLFQDEALGETLRERLERMLEERFGDGWPRRWMEEPAMLEHRPGQGR